MAVVFDSASFRSADTSAAAKVVFQEQSARSTIDFDLAGGMSAVMEAWAFGGASMFRATMTGNRLWRSARDIRHCPSGRVALAVQERGIGCFEQFGVQQWVRPGELMIVDLDAPYEFGWAGLGSSRCLHVPFDALGLSHAEFAGAADRLGASPLHDIVRRHVGRLWAGAEGGIGAAASRDLGEATISLARVLLRSAASGERVRDPRIDG